MKDSSIVPTKIYLGSKVGKVQLPNRVEEYSIIMSQYMHNTVKNVDKYLHERGLVLIKKALTSLLTKYSPEVDKSPYLGEREAALYQSLIGILICMLEMGRLDICLEFSVMSSFFLCQEKVIYSNCCTCSRTSRFITTPE